MSYCLNIRCPKPVNPDRATFCTTCGTRLRLGDRLFAFQPIGLGHSSRTFLARDESKLVDARCILKEYEQIGDGEALRKEIMRLDPILQHPQIPRLYAYFERKGFVYLVQEFISGTSLLQEMQTFGAFDEAKIWALLEELLPVLQFLHTHRVIHRDVKPANLIRRDTGGGNSPLVLVDFGAAKYASHSALARVGTVIGSAEYVAPEQLLGQATFASDLYSLGATCIHLLTGLSPFELVNPADGDWVWRSVAGQVGDRLAEIMDRLLAKDLERRYGSVEEVLWDVQAVQGHSKPSPTARPVATPAASAPSSPSIPPGESWHCAVSQTVGTQINDLQVSTELPRCIIAGNDGKVYTWAMDPETPLEDWSAHRQPIEAIALLPDGEVVTAGRDRTLKVWERLKDGYVLQQTWVGHGDIVTAIALDATGKVLYSSSRDQTIRGWDLASGTLRHTFEQGAAVESLCASPVHPFLVSGDAQGRVALWHTGTGEHLRSFAKHGGGVGAVALISLEPMRVPADPDRLGVLSSGWDMETRLRNGMTGGLYRLLRGHHLPVTAIALRGDGQRWATASHDGTIRIWSVGQESAVAILEGSHPIGAIAFTPAGDLVCGRQDGRVELWQPDAGA
jgi:serine/threonine protein kinase